MSGGVGGRHPCSPPVPSPTCVCRAVLPVPGPAVPVSEQGQGHRVGTATERWQSRGELRPPLQRDSRERRQKMRAAITAEGLCVFWGRSRGGGVALSPCQAPT